MCLVLEESQLERLVAEEDIPIFKVIRLIEDTYGFVTLFQLSEVEFDKLTESFLEEPRNGVGYVGDTDGELYGGMSRVGISKGIHVLDKNVCDTDMGKIFLEELLGYTSDSKLIRGFIPKGSEYYHNPIIHSIATDRVVYLKESLEI